MRKHIKHFWTKLSPQLSWLISFTFLIFIVIFVIKYVPDTINTDDLSSNISLLTQVLSVLIGFSFVGTTLHLSGYSVSKHVSDLLSEIECIASKLGKKYLSRRNKLTNTNFLNFLLNSPDVDRLKFRDKKEVYTDYYIYRPYMDGVWYQIGDSPFINKKISDAEMASIRALHEVVICSAKVLGIICELHKNKLNLLSKKWGSQGSIWFLKRFEKITKDFSSLKHGRTPDQMRMSDAIELTSLAIYSEHYIFDELNHYFDEVNWDPYNLTYFEVIFSEYLLWMGYLIKKLHLLRLTRAEIKSKDIAKKFTDATKKSIGLIELNGIKADILEIRKRAISEFGVNKRYKEIRKASIPGIGTGILALFLIVLLWPIQLSLTDSNHIKYLFAGLYGMGVLGIIHCGFFVKQMLLGIMDKQNRSPMGYRG